MFPLQQSYDISDSPWCNNSYCAYQELIQGNFCLFDQEKFSILPGYLEEQSNHNKNHVYLIDSQYSTCILKEHCRP